MSSAPRALAGVRVLDLTQFLAGPYGTMMLADLGADVVKIEPPGGAASSRGVPPFYRGESIHFLSLNRNKRSITLNLKDDRGRALLYDLVRGADVVASNFTPASRDALGLGYHVLRQHNPRVIACSISAFGDGEGYADRPGYDYLMQALGGAMSLTGDPDGPPTKAGISIVDHVAGLMAAIGILAALQRRALTGEGEEVEVSLFDAQISLLSYVATIYLLTGEVVGRVKNSAHPSLVAAQGFRTRDGHIAVFAWQNAEWRGLCRVLGLDHLAESPLYATPAQRSANRDVLVAALETALASRGTAEVGEALLRAHVPAAPVNSVDQALDHPLVAQRHMVARVSHPLLGSLKLVGNPIKLGVADGEMRPPPSTGEHTADVLAEALGLSADAIERLRKEGVV